MTTVTKSQVWWRTAANPPCSPWCSTDHDPKEFNEGAALLCRLTIVDDDELQVDLQQGHYGEEAPDRIDSDEPTVYLHLKFARESTEISKAIHGAESLAMALGKAKAIAEGRA